MQKKPFNKDIPSFIRDDKNWITVWRSYDTKLRIDRLKYTSITRLVREGIFIPYSSMPAADVLAYDFTTKKCFNEFVRFNHTYIDTQPSQAAIIQAVNSQWGTVNDDNNGGFCQTGNEEHL